MTAVGDGRKGALGFVQHEAAGGLMLLVAAIAALLVCNSPLAGLYEYFSLRRSACAWAASSWKSRCCFGSTKA